jgi:hypothetical protein
MLLAAVAVTVSAGAANADAKRKLKKISTSNASICRKQVGSFVLRVLAAGSLEKASYGACGTGR